MELLRNKLSGNHQHPLGITQYYSTSGYTRREETETLKKTRLKKKRGARVSTGTAACLHRDDTGEKHRSVRAPSSAEGHSSSEVELHMHKLRLLLDRVTGVTDNTALDS